jgi:hypothetical protein
MSIIGKARACDGVSLGLAVAALLGLATALAAAPLSGRPAIPDRLLDRVRGANPAYWRSLNPNWPNCSSLNVYAANSAGGSYVTYYNCAAAGTPCMSCALNNNYQINRGAGNPDCFPKPIGAVNCNNASRYGQIGACTSLNGAWFCNLTTNYNCDTFGFNYDLE